MDLGVDLLHFETRTRHVLRLVFHDHGERIEILYDAPVLRRLFPITYRAKLDPNQIPRPAPNVIRDFVAPGELFEFGFRSCLSRTRLSTILSFTQTEVYRGQRGERQKRHRKTNAGGKSTH